MGDPETGRIRMKKAFPLRLLALAAGALLALAAHAAPWGADAAHADAAARAEPEVQPASALPATRASVRVRASERHEIVLAAPPASTKLYDNGKHGVPMQVGIARDVGDLADSASFQRQLAWETLEDGGRVAAISVTSPGAAALRMGLVVDALPAGTMLRFYAPDAAPVDVSASDVLQALAANAAAGASGTAARTYWSPVVEGATIVLEIEIPAHASTKSVRLSAPSVSHLETTAAKSFALPKATVAACELDAMCYTSQWGNEISAEARIVFTDGGSSFVCSGTLVADKDTGTNIPYFLTANHCVDTQVVASSVQSFWFYNSTACNSGTRSTLFTAIAPGATLLYASGTTDTSLIRFNSPPPAGAGYAGWNVAASPAQGAAVTGIHHPKGDLTRISFGSINAFSVCSPSGTDSFTCSGSGNASSTFYAIDWASGVTEQGSSGSGLFLNNGKYLIGQLYGGNGTCDAPGNDWYGRFDVAYGNGNLGQWLATTQASSGPVPAFDYSDLWWNPGESGWGLSLVQHPSSHALYGAWYVYDAAGAPTWVVMPGGTWNTSTSFTGDLYATTGPDPRGAFDAALVSRTKVGTASLTFSSSGQGVLSWTAWGTSGSRTITRQPFGAPDAAPATNYQDLWWNSSESGWGLSINQQYRTLFAVWYAYGSDGRPMWYVMPGGSWTNANTYSGTVYRTSSAPTAFLEGGSLNPGTVTRTVAGSMSITFTSSSTATMGYSIDGVAGTKAITRQPF